MTLKAVIFDMDGLMLDSERVCREVWLEAGRRANVPVDDALYRELIGRNMADIRAYLADVLAPHCADVPAFIDSTQAAAHERLRGHVPCKPGLFELLDYLEARGIPKGVATSTGAILAKHKLESAGLLDRFHSMTTGNEVAHSKPDPEIFQLAAKRLGFSPAECLVLEDSSAGVRAAHAAGATVVMIPDLIEPTDELRAMADAVITSLSGIPGYIDKRFGANGAA